MINPQLFFVKGTVGDLRRIAAKYPEVRKLYSRKDALRGASVMSVFAELTGNAGARRRADSVWATAMLTKSFHDVTYMAAEFLKKKAAAVQVSYVARGGTLPRQGIGLAFCPSAPVYTTAVLLDEMRVLKWCSDTCVPTFGLVKTLADTVLIHAEA